MSRPMLIVSVALAAYALLNATASIAVAVAWRRRAIDAPGLRPAFRARRIVMARAVPTAAAALLTLGLVTPGFAAFEPVRDAETAGPALIAAALAGAWLIAAALVLAARTAMLTFRLERAWLRSATPFDFDPPAGVPAYAIDSNSPIVALVGVFSPKLLAARAVIESCTREELASIVAHERGHLDAMDNLKRWLMACAPDTLRWTATHREMAAAWCDAAEDAADDAAAEGGAMARLDLAALLVKVARLTPHATWSTATVSPFVDASGLDRRVRRLIEPDPGVDSCGRTPLLPFLAAAFVASVLAGLNSPHTLQTVHRIVESLVAFAR